MTIIELACHTPSLRLSGHSGTFGQVKDTGNNDIKKQFILFLQEKMLLHLLLFDSRDKMLTVPNLKEKRENACCMLNKNEFRALVSQATVTYF